MTSIADAYVELHVSGDNLEGEVRSEVKDAGVGADKESDKSGQRIGRKMSRGFTKGFRSVPKDIGKSLDKINDAVFRGLRGDLNGFRDLSRGVRKTFSGAFTSVRRTVSDTGRYAVKTFKTVEVRAKSAFAKVKASASKAFKGIKDSFEGMSLDLGKMKIPAIIALIPIATSGISALTGALTGFIGAAAQAAPAAAAVVGVIGALIQAKLVGKLAFAGFTDAVKGDADALKALSPNARVAAKAVQSLSGEWKSLKRTVQDTTFRGLGKVIQGVGKQDLPILQKGLQGTANVFNQFLKRLGKMAESEGFAKRLGKALAGNNAIISNLVKSAVPGIRGLLNVLLALQPSAVRLSKIILNVARAFAAWANAPGRADSIDKAMRRAFKTAGSLAHILGNVGGILRNVFGAAAPSGKGTIKTLEGLTSRLRKFTALASSKNAIAKWAKEGRDATGRLFTGLGKGFMAVKGLFSPQVFSGFLNIFQKVFPVIKSVVQALQAALAPALERIGEAFKKNGPKFAALFEALKPLLKGVGAVLGEVVGQSLDLLGTVAGLITPIVRIVSKFLGPILTRFAPIIASVILVFGAWEGKLIEMIPVIGKFLAPIVRLASWLLDRVGPAVKVTSKIFEVGFKFIADAIGLSARLSSGFVRVYFGTIFKVLKFVMEGAWKVIKAVWKGISAVFERYAPAIKIVVEYYFKAMRAVVETYIRIIKTVVTTAWRVISGATKVAWSAIKTLIVNPVTGAVKAVKAGLDLAYGFFKKIPNKILSLATSFLNAGTKLGDKIINGLLGGLSATGGFLKGIGEKVKDAINSALHLPVHIKGPGPLPDFDIPAFYRGTRSAPGGMALVGERGPEIVNLPRGSGVTPAGETRRILEDNRTMGPEQAVYIGTLAPHDYNDFRRQMAAERRVAALGPRRPVAATA